MSVSALPPLAKTAVVLQCISYLCVLCIYKHATCIHIYRCMYVCMYVHARRQWRLQTCIHLHYIQKGGICARVLFFELQGFIVRRSGLAYNQTWELRHAGCSSCSLQMEEDLSGLHETSARRLEDITWMMFWSGMPLTVPGTRWPQSHNSVAAKSSLHPTISPNCTAKALLDLWIFLAPATP